MTPDKHCPLHPGIKCLGVLLFLFLGTVLLASCAGKKKTTIVKETLLVDDSSWDGEKLPPYPQGQPQITVLKYTIPAGAALEPHRHPTINSAVVLRGQLEVIDENGNTRQLKAGDALIELVNTIHYGRNKSRKPAEILVFYAGTPGIPLVESGGKHP